MPRGCGIRRHEARHGGPRPGAAPGACDLVGMAGRQRQWGTASSGRTFTSDALQLPWSILASDHLRSPRAALRDRLRVSLLSLPATDQLGARLDKTCPSLSSMLPSRQTAALVTTALPSTASSRPLPGWSCLRPHRPLAHALGPQHPGTTAQYSSPVRSRPCHEPAPSSPRAPGPEAPASRRSPDHLLRTGAR